jgi:predicted nucleic acid-binding Zn ribbon protein
VALQFPLKMCALQQGAACRTIPPHRVQEKTMPTYDYRCEADQKVYEVKHSISELLHTWGELCEHAGFAAGDIAPDSKVTRLISSAGVVKSSSLKNPEAPPCMSGGGCSGGSCGF